MSEEKPKDTAVVSDTNNKAKYHGVRDIFRPTVVVILIVLLLVAAGLSLINKHSGNKAPQDVAFVVEGKDYTKADILPAAKALSNSNGKSLDDAGRTIFNYYKEQKAAQEVGIIVPQPAIDAQKSLLRKVFPQKSAVTLVDITAYHNALQDYYSNSGQGLYKGYSFAFDFSDRLIPEDLTTPVTGHGDPKLIAQDQAYAKKQADFYHDQIASSKLTEQQLLDKIHADATLGLSDKNVRFTTLDSTSFDTTMNNYLQSQVYHADIAQYILGQTTTGLSDVRLANVRTTPEGSTAKFAPGVYYFVQITEAQKGVSNAQGKAVQQVKNMKASYYGV